MKSRLGIFLASLALLGLGGVDAGAESPVIEAGERAASGWIQTVDDGRYQEAWDRSASYFRADVGRDRWTTMMEQGRKGLGPVVSRNVRSKHFTRTLPGAPAGEYVVVEYETAFQEKGAAVEKVTTTREGDGVWRVSAYIFGY